MSKIYKLALNEDNIDKLINSYNGAARALTGREFKQFLLEKCIKARDEVMKEHLYSSSIDEDETHNSEKLGLYESGNHEQINGNIISLYNDSVIDIASTDTFFSEKYRDSFYPSELSLAELVEYGAGLVGANSSLNTGDEWSYEVNGMRNYNEGWYYKNGEVAEHTQGSEGKYIYFYLAKVIEDNVNDWVEEFLESKLGSGV